jgi:hypothetical protein
MPTSRQLLRWIAVLPAGILAAALVAFPVHWLVMINLGGWGMDPIIEIRNPQTLQNIERFLQACFGSLAFIYFASRTAPNCRRTTSYMLASLIVIGLPILVHWLNSASISRGYGVMIEYGFANILANVLGSAGGIYLIYAHERKGSDRGGVDMQE